MQYPEIRFRDSFLLVDTIYPDIEPAYVSQETGMDERYKLGREAIGKTLYSYEQAWLPYGDKIVRGICEILDLEFRQNVIDLYAAPFYQSFSFPLFIATKYEPDRAVDVIAHELIHVLLYDNTVASLDLAREERAWQKMFKGLDDNVVATLHVPVHAVLQALFDDILGEPERTARDKKMCEKYPDYKIAWEYVDKVGYKEVIEQLRISYRRLSEQRSV